MCMQTHRGLTDLTARPWFTLCWAKYPHATEQIPPRGWRCPPGTFACVTFVMFKCFLMRLVEDGPSATKHAWWHYTYDTDLLRWTSKERMQLCSFVMSTQYSCPWSDELMWFTFTQACFQKQLLTFVLLSSYSCVITTDWETHGGDGFSFAPSERQRLRDRGRKWWTDDGWMRWMWWIM